MSTGTIAPDVVCLGFLLVFGCGGGDVAATGDGSGTGRPPALHQISDGSVAGGSFPPRLRNPLLSLRPYCSLPFMMVDCCCMHTSGCADDHHDQSCKEEKFCFHDFKFCDPGGSVSIFLIFFIIPVD